MALNERQKAFAYYYIQTGNATEAAIKAGYSEKTAYSIGNENLKKPVIQNYIDKRLKQLEDERIAKADEVLKYLTKGMRQELTEEVVVTEGIGDGCSEVRVVTKKISLKDSNKCAELLGKRYRLFTEKVEVDGVQQVQIVDDIDE